MIDPNLYNPDLWEVISDNEIRCTPLNLKICEYQGKYILRGISEDDFVAESYDFKTILDKVISDTLKQ